MKITKADFREFVDFTINLEDRLIEPFITKAFLRDVKPKITDALAELVLADSVLVVENTAIVDDVNNTFSPVVTVAPDVALYQAVRPYWVLAAYHRHILIHGIFHTQSGLTTPSSNTNDQISDKRRAELMAQVKSDMNFYEGEMMKYVKANFPALFDTACCAPTKRKNRIGLRVVKNERHYGCDDGRREYRG